MIKLEYTENKKNAIIFFEVWLNKDISSKITIHTFSSLNDIFESTNEVEQEFKVKKVPITRLFHLQTS